MNLKINGFLFITLIIGISSSAQINWINVDSIYQPLPSSVHVFKSIDSLEGKPNISYYIIAPLKDRELIYTTDTTYNRRFTPTQFYKKNNKPLAVVNTTFFSFQTNQNLNLVIRNKELLAYNSHTIPLRGADTLQHLYRLRSAIGISKNRRADIAWTITDSSKKYSYASQKVLPGFKIPDPLLSLNQLKKASAGSFKKWKMETAVGGGPVLLQNSEILITNEEERMFAGKAIQDKHPRTAMGYTADGNLIILVVQGRTPGIADGVTLPQLAQILKDLGCIEALNLDGGGSSCLLINGKETITPSDKEGQRAVPAVFIIQERNKIVL
jgi:hypothetical protein